MSIYTLQRIFWTEKNNLPATNMLHFFELLAEYIGPRSILTHDKGNDLGKYKSMILIRQMKKHISTLHESLQKGLIMYSKHYLVTEMDI